MKASFAEWAGRVADWWDDLPEFGRTFFGALVFIVCVAIFVGLFAGMVFAFVAGYALLGAMLAIVTMVGFAAGVATILALF